MGCMGQDACWIQLWSIHSKTFSIARDDGAQVGSTEGSHNFHMSTESFGSSQTKVEICFAIVI